MVITEDMKSEICRTIDRYYETMKEKEFIPGKTKIRYAGPIFDQNEVKAVLLSLLDEWLVIGKRTREFERKFAEFMGSNFCVTVNSGSSANLLALACLKNPKIKDALRPGDEIITAALSHPATVNAILLNGLTPVLVDVEQETLNIDPELVARAISKETRGVFLTHFLGNPCDMERLQEIVEENFLYMVEDCCDAHGAEYENEKVGNFGDLGTFSFYPAHMITMGEGGAIIGRDRSLESICRSLRGWGAMCSGCLHVPCKLTVPPYKCPMRYQSEIKGLEHYDSRHLFIDMGYNLKITEMQAAFGIEQIKRMASFIEARRRNWERIVKFLSDYDEYLILQKPTPRSKPVWFSVGITVRPGAPFKRYELVKWLEDHRIETRHFFGGNVVNQPAYRNVRFKIVGELKNSELTTHNSFYIGCSPTLTEEMISYMAEMFSAFFKKYT